MLARSTTDSPAAAPRDAGAAPERRAADERPDPAPARRFADVLARQRGPRGETADAARDDDALRCAARAAARCSAGVPADPACSAPVTPSPAVVPPPEIGLADVRLAGGADGTYLRFGIEEGGLAGAHMAFLLRGDVLDVTIEAPDAELSQRLRDLQDSMRETLAARGFELGRYDADGGGRPRDDRQGADDAPHAGARPHRRTTGGATLERNEHR